MIKKTCGTCVLPQYTRDGSCPFFQKKMSDENPSCTEYRESINTCDLCGNPFLEPPTLTHCGDEWKMTCERCERLSGTCPTCKKVHICSFETDPSPLPKMVQKVARQGPAQILTMEKNPDRINITCKAGCDCWDNNENYCLRECGTCGRYIHVFVEEEVNGTSDSSSV